MASPSSFSNQQHQIPKLTDRTSQIGLLLGLIWGMEVGLMLALVGAYKVPDWASASITSNWVLVTFTGGVIAAAFVSAVICVTAGNASRRHHDFAVAAGVNLLSLVLLSIMLESTLRLLVSATPEGRKIGAVTLHRSWQETRQRNSWLLGQVYSGESAAPYFVPDSELGWVVGNDRSALGLYASGESGIRTATPGDVIDESPGMRVALVGDSYAFSMEVGYQASFGYHLEQELGRNAQVLNFGVDGYGIDQAYLRYLRDVRRWNPTLVLFCFRQHDLYRTMAVYAYLAFPTWEFPFAKPRFVLIGDDLQLMTGELPDPWAMTRLDAPQDLPLIELEAAFDPLTTRLQAGPMAIRYLTAVLPRWTDENPALARQQIVLTNRILLDHFTNAARRSGSDTLGVFFPAGAEGNYPDSANTLAREMIDRSALEVLDLASCMRLVPAERRKVSGGTHNSDAANAAAARCVAEAIGNIFPGIATSRQE